MMARIARMVVVALALLGTRDAAAAPEAPQSGGPLPDAEPLASKLPRVDLVLVGGRHADAILLQGRIESWFREQVADWSATRLDRLSQQAVLAPPAGLPAVRVWVVLGPSAANASHSADRLPQKIRLFFCVQGPADANPRYLARDVALDHGLDELGVERVAQLVYPSVVALWEGRGETPHHEVEEELRSALRLEPEPAWTASAQTAPAPTSLADGIVWSLGVEYGVRLRGDEGVAHGPGLLFGLRHQSRQFELGARLHTQLLLPVRVDMPPGVNLELFGGSFRMGGWLQTRCTRVVSLSGELGVGLDVLETKVRSVRVNALRAAEASFRPRPFGYVSLGVSFDAGRLRLGLVASAVVQFTRVHYDIVQAETRSEQGAPWAFQPGLAAEGSWE